MSTTVSPVVRELDRRTNDGFDVRLLWTPQTDRVSVTVEHQRHGDFFTLEVDPSDALEAFNHPFAYASKAYNTQSQRLVHSPAKPPRRVEER